MAATVTALETRGFRNLADDRVELGEGVVVFWGPNGAGKTNLLEAVYFGLVNRSFRAGNDRDMIRFDEGAARVELELSTGAAREPVLLSALERGGERRHRLGGRELAGADPERPLVSVFHPDRLALVKGPAAHRRAHLDRLVGALWPARAGLRTRFGRTLSQRNALVSRVRAGLADPASLPSWDARLAAEAEPLMASRAEAGEALAAPFSELAASLGLDEPSVAYRPRADGGAEEIEAELERRRTGDLGRAYTSYGPQLDEVELRLGGRPLRRFGSQGQQRAGLLALLFAERAALIDAGRPAPIMLLDDVMSELDPERRELLVATLDGAGQALLTATEAAHVPGERARRIAVREGRAIASAPADAGGAEAA
jgi:DNA replication and repair protein RecF